MRIRTMVFAAALLMLPGALAAATPDMEQAFITAFKTAAEARDGEAMKVLIHTDGVSQTMLDFYLMVLTAGFAPGGEVTVGLQPLNPDDVADAARAMTGPGGALVRLSPAPYKKLVVTVAIRAANGRATTTNTVYVADEGDRIRIVAPVEVR